MANSEAGWTKEFPKVDGAYYVRLIGDAVDLTLVRVEDGIVHEFGVAIDFGERDYEDCEWLGPISPSDAEQLMELRKACKAALPYVREVLAYTRSKPRIRCATRTIEQLRKAIGGTNEKTVNRRNVSMERESRVQRMDTNGEPDADNRHSTSNDVGSSEEDGEIP